LSSTTRFWNGSSKRDDHFRVVEAALQTSGTQPEAPAFRPAELRRRRAFVDIADREALYQAMEGR
jgi:hypothetical protein